MKTKIGLSFITAVLIAFSPFGIHMNVLTGQKVSSVTATSTEVIQVKPPLNDLVRTYLESKKSPLAPKTDLLLQQEHWKLLIAISAIESQYCTRKIDNNCWGIGGDSAYKHYRSIEEAIVDANSLISRWQKRGRWLTVDDMNCHYVQPCNPNWVYVVNNVLDKLNGIESPNTTSQQAK